MEPQLRHIVGRPVVASLAELLGKIQVGSMLTSVMLPDESITLRILKRKFYDLPLVTNIFKQAHQVVRVLFFHCQYAFEHSARRRIIVSKILNHFAITVDGNAFGN
jgi:hypothetical protein